MKAIHITIMDQNNNERYQDVARPFNPFTRQVGVDQQEGESCPFPRQINQTDSNQTQSTEPTQPQTINQPTTPTPINYYVPGLDPLMIADLPTRKAVWNSLAPIEKDIIKLYMDHHSIEMISSKLNISLISVYRNMRNAKSKLRLPEKAYESKSILNLCYGIKADRNLQMKLMIWIRKFYGVNSNAYKLMKQKYESQNQNQLNNQSVNQTNV